MATLVTGDLHLNLKPGDVHRFKFLSATLPHLIRKYAIRRLIICGDLTDQKDRHPSRLVNRIVDQLWKLSGLCEVIILKGNHDREDEEWPFFRFVQHLDNVQWINEPVMIGPDWFLPHCVNWKDCRPPDKVRFIYTHLTFAGAIGESGRELSGVPLDAFGDARIISGDVHVPQEVGKVTYVGAPYHIRFGDEFDPRVLVVAGATCKSIPVEGPRKILLTLEWPQLPPDHWQGNQLKIRVQLKPKHRAKFPEIRQQIRQWCEEHDCDVHSITPLTPQEQPLESKRHVRSDNELMHDYAHAKNVDDKTLRVGLDLLDETETGT